MLKWDDKKEWALKKILVLMHEREREREGGNFLDSA